MLSKKHMLEEEGVKFDAYGRVSQEALYAFDEQSSAPLGHPENIRKGEHISQSKTRKRNGGDSIKRQRTAATATPSDLTCIEHPTSKVNIPDLCESILNLLEKRGPGKSC